LRICQAISEIVADKEDLASWRVLLAAGMGNFLDGYDLTIVGVVMIMLKPLWHLSPEGLGLLGGSAVAGSLCGAPLGGFISDRFGRKSIFLLDIVGFVGGALLCGLASGIGMLALFRFIVGLAIGADYPLSSTYLAECAPAETRGRFMSLSLGFWMAGAIVSALVGFVLLGLGPYSWRWMFVSGAIPGVIVLALRAKLPESPLWKKVKSTSRPQSPWKDPNRGGSIRLWAFVCLPRFCLDLTGYALHIYLPLLLLGLGLRDTHASVLGNAAFLSIFVFGWAINLIFIDRVGRLRLQIVGFFGDAIGLGIVGFAALSGQPSMAAIVVGLVVYQIANFAGPGITSWMLPVEVFPTELRGAAQGISTAFAHAGGVLVAIILPLSVHHFGVGRTLLLLSVAALGGALLSTFLGVETAKVRLD
jgi:putative MFS transporter